MVVARNRLLGRGRTARLHAPRLSARARGARRGADRGPSRRPPASPASVSLIVAAHDEEEVIEAKVADALALDYPRELLELIVASDGSTDDTVELARAAGADRVLDLGRVGKIEAQNAARRARLRRAARVQRRERELGAGRAARARRPVRRRARRLRLRSGPLPRPGRLQPGGRLLALRARDPRARVAARRGHGGQRRDLRGSPRGLPAARAGFQPRPLVPVHAHQARLARRLRAAGGGRGEDGGDRSRASSRASAG